MRSPSIDPLSEMTPLLAARSARSAAICVPPGKLQFLDLQMAVGGRDP